MLRSAMERVLCLGILLVVCLSGTVYAGGFKAPDQLGRYTNAVLVGKTAGGEDVVLTAGVHDHFPLPGVIWDNFVLRVGDRGYVFTTNQRKATPSLRFRMRSPGTFWNGICTLSFRGRAKVVDLRGPGVPVVRPKDTRYPTKRVRFVLVAHNLKKRTRNRLFPRMPNVAPIKFFSWGLQSFHVSLKVGSKRVPMQRDSLTGHVEKGDPLPLNLPDENLARRQPALMVYDYNAGHRYRDHRRSLVRTRGRTILNRRQTRFGGKRDGAPVSPWLTIRGRGVSLGALSEQRTETDLVSEVRIGPRLVLERRLVRFNVGAEKNWFYKNVLGWRTLMGLKEVFRYEPQPLPDDPDAGWLAGASERTLAELYRTKGQMPDRRDLNGTFRGFGAIVSPGGVLRGIRFQKQFDRSKRAGRNILFGGRFRTAPFDFKARPSQNDFELIYDIRPNRFTPFRFIKDTLRQVSEDVFVGQINVNVPYGPDVYLGMFALRRK